MFAISKSLRFQFVHFRLFAIMAPKRKTESVPEPSPPTKRRTTKVKTLVEKKRPRETDEQDAATRVRRSKKKSSDDESVAESVVVAAVTPRKRATKVKAESPVINTRTPVAPKSSLKSASKPRSR